MSMFHAVNSTVNGHLLVFWAMALNTGLYFQRGGGLALMGILCGAVALMAAHYTSGEMYADRDPYKAGYVACASATALAWVFFILAASL